MLAQLDPAPVARELSSHAIHALVEGPLESPLSHISLENRTPAHIRHEFDPVPGPLLLQPSAKSVNPVKESGQPLELLVHRGPRLGGVIVVEDGNVRSHG
jgi:hypothetical protein